MDRPCPPGDQLAGRTGLPTAHRCSTNEWAPPSEDICRVTVATRQVEKIVDPQRISRLIIVEGAWIGITPEGTPMVTLDGARTTSRARLGGAVTQRAATEGADESDPGT